MRKDLTKMPDESSISSMTGRKNYISQITGDEVSRQANHFTVRLAQMKYDKHQSAPIALARGKYKGFPFLILSLGTHPTAYVCVPKGHKFYKKGYSTINASGIITPHGGVTYTGEFVAKSSITDKWWVGWDYAHPLMGDYTPLLPDNFYHTDAKKWTREEVISEVKDVIDQLDIKVHKIK